MLDIFFELAIFFTKKHLFISLSPNCKIKIAYVWTGPKFHKSKSSISTTYSLQFGPLDFLPTYWMLFDATRDFTMKDVAVCSNMK